MELTPGQSRAKTQLSTMLETWRTVFLAGDEYCGKSAIIDNITADHNGPVIPFYVNTCAMLLGEKMTLKSIYSLIARFVETLLSRKNALVIIDNFHILHTMMTNPLFKERAVIHSMITYLIKQVNDDNRLIFVCDEATALEYLSDEAWMVKVTTDRTDINFIVEGLPITSSEKAGVKKLCGNIPISKMFKAVTFAIRSPSVPFVQAFSQALKVLGV